MPTYFHGWRRKLGVLTLLVACVFAVGWVRSFSRIDQFCFHMIWEETFLSAAGSLFWWSVDRPFDANAAVPIWFTDTIENWCPEDDDRKLNYLFRWMGFEIIKQSEVVLLRIIPYWSIVIPLTLFSAYLLLSKPRTKKPPAEST